MACSCGAVIDEWPYGCDRCTYNGVRIDSAQTPWAPPPLKRVTVGATFGSASLSGSGGGLSFVNDYQLGAIGDPTAYTVTNSYCREVEVWRTLSATCEVAQMGKYPGNIWWVGWKFQEGVGSLPGVATYSTMKVKGTALTPQISDPTITGGDILAVDQFTHNSHDWTGINLLPGQTLYSRISARYSTSGSGPIGGFAGVYTDSSQNHIYFSNAYVRYTLIEIETLV